MSLLVPQSHSPSAGTDPAELEREIDRLSNAGSFQSEQPGRRGLRGSRVKVEWDWMGEGQAQPQRQLEAGHIKNLENAMAQHGSAALSLQGFGIQDVYAVTDLIKTLDCRELDVSFCRLGEKKVFELMTELLEDAQIEFLDLSFNQVCFKTLKKVTQHLPPSLTILSLRYNPITANGFMDILYNASHIEVLDVRCCGLFESGACGTEKERSKAIGHLLTWFRTDETSQLNSLWLEGNGFSEDEEIMIIEAIKYGKHKFKELCFQSNPEGTPDTSEFNAILTAGNATQRKGGSCPEPSEEEVRKMLLHMAQYAMCEMGAPLIEVAELDRDIYRADSMAQEEPGMCRTTTMPLGLLRKKSKTRRDDDDLDLDDLLSDLSSEDDGDDEQDVVLLLDREPSLDRRGDVGLDDSVSSRASDLGALYTAPTMPVLRAGGAATQDAVLTLPSKTAADPAQTLSPDTDTELFTRVASISDNIARRPSDVGAKSAVQFSTAPADVAPKSPSTGPTTPPSQAGTLPASPAGTAPASLTLAAEQLPPADGTLAADELNPRPQLERIPTPPIGMGALLATHASFTSLEVEHDTAAARTSPDEDDALVRESCSPTNGHRRQTIAQGAPDPEGITIVVPPLPIAAPTRRTSWGEAIEAVVEKRPSNLRTRKDSWGQAIEAVIERRASSKRGLKSWRMESPRTKGAADGAAAANGTLLTVPSMPLLRTRSSHGYMKFTEVDGEANKSSSGSPVARPDTPPDALLLANDSVVLQRTVETGMPSPRGQGLRRRSRTQSHSPTQVPQEAPTRMVKSVHGRLDALDVPSSASNSPRGPASLTRSRLSTGALPRFHSPSPAPTEPRSPMDEGSAARARAQAQLLEVRDGTPRAIAVDLQTAIARPGMDIDVTLESSVGSPRDSLTSSRATALPVAPGDDQVSEGVASASGHTAPTSGEGSQLQVRKGTNLPPSQRQTRAAAADRATPGADAKAKPDAKSTKTHALPQKPKKPALRDSRDRTPGSPTGRSNDRTASPAALKSPPARKNRISSRASSPLQKSEREASPVVRRGGRALTPVQKSEQLSSATQRVPSQDRARRPSASAAGSSARRRSPRASSPMGGAIEMQPFDVALKDTEANRWRNIATQRAFERSSTTHAPPVSHTMGHVSPRRGSAEGARKADLSPERRREEFAKQRAMSQRAFESADRLFVSHTSSSRAKHVGTRPAHLAHVVAALSRPIPARLSNSGPGDFANGQDSIGSFATPKSSFTTPKSTVSTRSVTSSVFSHRSAPRVRRLSLADAAAPRVGLGVAGDEVPQVRVVPSISVLENHASPVAEEASPRRVSPSHQSSTMSSLALSGGPVPVRKSSPMRSRSPRGFEVPPPPEGLKLYKRRVCHSDAEVLNALYARGASEGPSFELLDTAIEDDDTALMLLGPAAYAGLAAGCGASQAVPELLRCVNARPSAIAMLKHSSPQYSAALAKLLHMLIDPAAAPPAACANTGALRTIRRSTGRREEYGTRISKTDYTVALTVLRKVRWAPTQPGARRKPMLHNARRLSPGAVQRSHTHTFGPPGSTLQPVA